MVKGEIIMGRIRFLMDSVWLKGRQTIQWRIIMLQDSSKQKDMSLDCLLFTMDI